MLRNNDVLGAFELFPDGVAQRDIGKNAPPAGNDDGPRALPPTRVARIHRATLSGGPARERQKGAHHGCRRFPVSDRIPDYR